METIRKAAKANSEAENERKRQSNLEAKLGDQSTYSVFIIDEGN
jgi:hypothetical protein